MSTRVEKGGHKFRPIARNKPNSDRAKQSHSRTRTPNVDEREPSLTLVDPVHSNASSSTTPRTSHTATFEPSASQRSLHETRAIVIPSNLVQQPRREISESQDSTGQATSFSNSYERHTSAVSELVSSRANTAREHSPTETITTGSVAISLEATRLIVPLVRESRALSSTPTDHSPFKHGTSSQNIVRVAENREDEDEPDRYHGHTSRSMNPPGCVQNKETKSLTRKKRDRSSTRSNHKRRREASLQGMVDNTVEAGDPLDPTATSMKDLCSAVGVGRVSSRHIEVQLAHAEAKKLERERRARIALVREAKDKRGEDLDDPDIPLRDVPLLTHSTALSVAVPDPQDTATCGIGDNNDYPSDLRANHFTVTMRMDASGQMIVDEDSLIVDRAANPDLIIQADSMEHVEETDASRFINSATHTRKARGSRWSKEETANFYQALRQFNTDFTMISMVMPGRSARECRNKFNSEDKKRQKQVDWALSNPLPIDMDVLSRMTGKNFRAVVPENGEGVGPDVTRDAVLPSSAAISQCVAEDEEVRGNDAGSEDLDEHSHLQRKLFVPAEEVEIMGDINDSRWQDDFG